jgi:2-polyprenyl-3-methyl-5-hydroxy-6-metoxy-1,4-benzoquinol methylase
MQQNINCPVCASNNFNEIVLLKDFPISNIDLATNKRDALKANVYDMNIVICKRCTHIYNEIPVQLEYKQTNTTYFTNDTQKKYISTLVTNLVNKFNIKNKNILEIGSGDGLFLKDMANYENNCIGFEPSYDKVVKTKRVTIINDYFDAKKNLDKDIDWIVIRHVVEHFDNPYSFIESGIMQNINPNTKLLIEVPNIQPTIDNLRINDFIHEHISHFSIYSLTYLLKRLNFDILDIYTTDNDENIVAICQINQNFIKSIDLSSKYSNGFNHIIQKLQNDFRNIAANSNDTICIWGAEGRGAGFIKTIKNDLRGDEIIVDSDSKKFNKYIPSAGLKIISYKELINQSIDSIIITTSLGKNNILQEIKDNNIQVTNIYVISEIGLDKVV